MKKVFIFILVGFASVILFELFLRFSPFTNGITPMTYDKEIGMWHKKNFANYIIDDCYKTKYFFDEEGRIKNNYEYSSKFDFTVSFLGNLRYHLKFYKTQRERRRKV